MRSQDNQGFQILKPSPKVPVILISPETGKLPTLGMGQMARFISAKSGGLGEVISALCKGLCERSIPTHLVTLELSRRFEEEAHMSDEDWLYTRHHVDPENIHLISSSIYENHRHAYEGHPVRTTIEFQKQILNTTIKEILCKFNGKAVIHTHDWMAGALTTAYAKHHHIPCLHTIHNTHTAHIPIKLLQGLNWVKWKESLYFSFEEGKFGIDAQASAIKNATKVNTVGQTFLDEMVDDYFMDRGIIPQSVRNEVKAKHFWGSIHAIPNGISPDLFPENQPEDPRPFTPGLAHCFSNSSSQVVEAKKSNLLKFQHKMGLQPDPEKILFFWPSRLDSHQKGIELFEDIAQKFAYEHLDVQFAVIGDPVDGEKHHARILGQIACASHGKIAYQPFNEDLCMLGYAAASDVFGASLYEPFGQIDVVGNIYGATATNRNTGGYSDKIKPLNLRAWGAPRDSGNGVLFEDYDTNGLWWGLHQATMNHRFLRANPEIWEIQINRIMNEARSNWSLSKMVSNYVSTYKQLSYRLQQTRPVWSSVSEPPLV